MILRGRALAVIVVAALAGYVIRERMQRPDMAALTTKLLPLNGTPAEMRC